MARLLQSLRRLVRKRERVSSLRFGRPLLIFQSDDWGRAGIRDRDGWNELRASGVDLGRNPYDFYSLETAEDLAATCDVLRRHRDAAGRHPSLVMNFIMANVDFDKTEGATVSPLPLIPLTQGLPSRWHRPGLLEAYRQGVAERLFYPALHGLTHFCENAAARAFAKAGERASLLRKLWSSQTAYIHWRMPWIGYEYWDPELTPPKRFLLAPEQATLIHRAAGIFRELFSAPPGSACAPGYRANADTTAAWFENGVRVAQNGPGAQEAPYVGEQGMLFTFRTAEMEPATTRCDLEGLVARAGQCFARGLPAIVSIHSINFHSTLRDCRTPTLALLDRFLTALERKWPEVLYVNDADLYSIVNAGSYRGCDGAMKVVSTVAEERA